MAERKILEVEGLETSYDMIKALKGVSISALSLNPSSKKIFCPAMNNQMWENSIIQENCKKLISHGWAQIGPESGRLACGNIGMGRLAKIDMILKNL